MMPSTDTRLTALLLVLALAGCSSSEKIPDSAVASQSLLSAQDQEELLGKPVHLRPQYSKLWQEGENNAVLNWLKLGTRAFHSSEINIAIDAFDSALSGIEAIYRDDPYAEQARSLWYSEGRKQFKGEPYERSMAYLYRGLLFLQEADYGNARASFESGIQQDAFAEEEQFRADFKSLYFLSAWAADKFGSTSLSEQAYDDLLSLDPSFSVSIADRNVLMVAMLGEAPRKLADGLGHNRLVYRTGKNIDELSGLKPRVGTDELQIDFVSLEDLYYQASTRGGRRVDAIVDGKLAFRESSSNIGKRATRLGDKIAESTRNSTSEQDKIGRYVAASRAIAALASGIGAKVRPEADIRQWTNLPGRLYVATATMPLSTTSITIEYVNERGIAVKQLTQELPLHFDKYGNALVVASTQHGSEK